MAVGAFLPLAGLKPRMSAREAVLTWCGLAGFSSWVRSGVLALAVVVALPVFVVVSICFSFFFAISRTSSREKAMALAGPVDLRSRSLRLRSEADMGGLEAEGLAGATGALAGIGLAGAALGAGF